jgi:hypothetical protein
VPTPSHTCHTGNLTVAQNKIKHVHARLQQAEGPVRRYIVILLSLLPPPSVVCRSALTSRMPLRLFFINLSPLLVMLAVIPNPLSTSFCAGNLGKVGLAWQATLLLPLFTSSSSYFPPLVPRNPTTFFLQAYALGKLRRG